MKNIILIGYMGCGKTTVGKYLAKITDYTFVDTDELIEEQQQKTISNIFAEDGEQTFRELETELLKRLVIEGKDQLVISTGGGMPLRSENRELLSKIGMVIYLKATPETIYNRVKGDTQRPLLQCERPFLKIKEMITARDPVYQEAAISILSVDGLRQSEVAGRILEEYEEEMI